jgi:hypothetical protein
VDLVITVVKTHKIVKFMINCIININPTIGVTSGAAGTGFAYTMGRSNATNLYLNVIASKDAETARKDYETAFLRKQLSEKKSKRFLLEVGEVDK